MSQAPSSGSGYGSIDTGDEVPAQKDYLLWSAGPDGLFGFDTQKYFNDRQPNPPPVTSGDLANVRYFDDVTNFKE